MIRRKSHKMRNKKCHNCWQPHFENISQCVLPSNCWNSWNCWNCFNYLELFWIISTVVAIFCENFSTLKLPKNRRRRLRLFRFSRLWVDGKLTGVVTRHTSNFPFRNRCFPTILAIGHDERGGISCLPDSKRIIWMEILPKK